MYAVGTGAKEHGKPVAPTAGTEYGHHNPRVGGSSPSSATNKFKALAGSGWGLDLFRATLGNITGNDGPLLEWGCSPAVRAIWFCTGIARRRSSSSRMLRRVPVPENNGTVMGVRSFGLACAVVGFLLAQGSLPASAQDRITWYHPNYPPTFILNGRFQGKGIVDVFERGVIERLTGYRHEVREANMKRVVGMLSSGAKACAASLFKTPEREKIITFSDPYLFVFPVGIAFRKSDARVFKGLADDQGRISLEKLLRDGKRVLGYSIGRSYHNEVDRLIASLANETNSFRISTVSVSQGVLRLLSHRRIDYAVGFSYEKEWLVRGGGFKDDFGFMPLQEAQNVQLNYMGCPKNDWGRRTIMDVNKALREIRTDPDFYGAYFFWISPEERERYRALLKQGFPEEKPQR